MTRLLSLLTRRLGPQAAPVDSLRRCENEIAEGIARRRAARLTRPARDEHKRFERARPKVLELRHELAMQRVDF